jgi:hypothetical protein
MQCNLGMAIYKIWRKALPNRCLYETKMVQIDKFHAKLLTSYVCMSQYRPSIKKRKKKRKIMLVRQYLFIFEVVTIDMKITKKKTV